MKYEFTGESKAFDGITLKRIRRIANGEVGGWIENETNLNQSGNAWVYDNARVWGDARVSGAARVYGNADFLLVGPIGSRRSFLTITADAKIKVRFTTGCFSGSRKQLIAAIKKTHKPTSRYAKEYAAALVMAKLVKAMKG